MVNVRVNTSWSLKPLTKYNAEIAEVDGSTVGECITSLVKRSPSVKKMLFDENSNLHGPISIYVNGEDTYPHELTTAVKDGDELYTLHMITEG